MLPDNLRELSGNPYVIEAFARLVAVSSSPGEIGRCPIPSHRADGWLVRRPDGRHRWECHCDGQSRALVDVFAAVVSCDPPRKRGESELVVWQIRMLVEGDLLHVPEVSLPPLPESSASEPSRRVHEGLRLLLGVRSLRRQPAEPFTFARRFAAEWSGVTTDEATAAIALLRRHVLEEAGYSGRALLFRVRRPL